MADNKTGNRNKGGRPRKEDYQRKGFTVRFRVTEPEYLDVKRRAEECKMPVSEYARHAVATGKIRTPISPERLRLVAELTRERNNLNQIARVQNAAGASAMADELDRIIRFYSETIDKLKRER